MQQHTPQHAPCNDLGDAKDACHQCSGPMHLIHEDQQLGFGGLENVREDLEALGRRAGLVRVKDKDHVPAARE